MGTYSLLSKYGISDAEMESLGDDSMVDAMHRHSELSASDGDPNPAVNVNADGKTVFSYDVGIGTDPPQTRFHIFGASPVIRVQDNDGFSNYLELTDSEATIAKIVKTVDSGVSILGIESVPSDGSSTSTIRLFFDTSTSGNKYFNIYKGDGTSTLQHSLASGTNSYVCADNNSFLVGATSLVGTEKLNVTGDAYVTGDVSALTFTDRTPFYDGDAVTAIKAISGKDGEIDHDTLPDFTKATHQKVTKTVTPGERIVIPDEEAWEEYAEDKEVVVTAPAESIKIVKGKEVKTIKNLPVIIRHDTKYKIEEGQVVSYQEPVFQKETITETKRRLKPGIKLDPETGELYRQDDIVEEIVEETPGRDLGAMISVLVKGFQQAIARIEAIENAEASK